MKIAAIRARTGAGLFLFALFAAASASAATVSGRITATADGAPIVGASVRVEGPLVGPLPVDTTTDADGRYSADYNCPVTCYVRTTADGYVVRQRMYSSNDTDLVFDFALDREAKVSGRVVLPPDAVALTHGPGLEKYNEETGVWEGAYIGSSTIDGDVYRYGKLNAGVYRLCYEEPDFVRECFDGYTQGPFVKFDYTAVSLAAGDVRNEVNFSPERGGSVSGRAFDGYANTDLVGYTAFYVTLYDENGGMFANRYEARLDAAGNYTFGGVAPGNYYLLGDAGIFQQRIYPNGDCVDDCDPLVHGELVNVPATGTVQSVDFAFRPYAVVRARVVDAVTDADIPNAALSGWALVWINEVSMSTRNWYDAAAEEFVTYNTAYGERIAGTAPGYVARFVNGGNCVNMVSCMAWPRLQQPRGDVRYERIRLTRPGDHVFFGGFE